eukprot:scaffold1753_cov59-Isochrysis_galbana.AAC.1
MPHPPALQPLATSPPTNRQMQVAQSTSGHDSDLGCRPQPPADPLLKPLVFGRFLEPSEAAEHAAEEEQGCVRLGFEPRPQLGFRGSQVSAGGQVCPELARSQPQRQARLVVGAERLAQARRHEVSARHLAGRDLQLMQPPSLVGWPGGGAAPETAGEGRSLRHGEAGAEGPEVK